MSVNIKNHPTLGARGFSFHSEAVIVSGEAAIEILAREKNFLSCQDLDRSFSAHNHSFLQKKNSGTLGKITVDKPKTSVSKQLRVKIKF